MFSYNRLGIKEREGISLGLAKGCSLRKIARSLNRNRSTIYREVARNSLGKILKGTDTFL